MEDFDSAKQNFDGEKICLENIIMDQNITMGYHNYSELEGKDRCPSLVEKSSAQFVFRVVLYLVMFTINVILLNVLIGQISLTLNKVMKEGDKDYYLRALELKARLSKTIFFEMNKSLLNLDKRKNLSRKKTFALRSILFWIFGLSLLNYSNIWTSIVTNIVTNKSMEQTQVDFRIVSSK